ncbi:ABC transporter ATP-binding protein [Pseudalkalibacillus sp. R45]|uniref:ABC transporter ATP-binding protein n=1 Tax=Pseudalkalibacillus sp. R45 TaxID=3457433 RepID=UPI003FCE50C1
MRYKKNQQREKSKEIRVERDSFRIRWFYLFRLIHLLLSLSRKEVLIIFIMMMISGFMPLLTLFSLRHLVDEVVKAVQSQAGELIFVISWTSLFILSMFLHHFTRIYGGATTDHIQEKIKATIQEKMLIKAQSMSLENFEHPEFYDQLQRAQQGIDQRLFSTMHFIFRIISTLTTIISLFIYLGLTNWLIPLVLLLGTIVFTSIRVRSLREQYLLQKEQTNDQRRLGYLAELMSGRKAAGEIRLFGLGDHLLGTWTSLNRKLRNERLNLVRRRFIMDISSSIGLIMTLGLTLSVVILFSDNSVLTAGMYAAFLTAILQFQQNFSMLFWDTVLIDNDLRYVQDFFQYMDLEEENIDGVSLQSTKLQKGINFESVSFYYPGSKKPVLQDITFHIKPGERIALVGANGSGKTTLVKLLLGLYSPSNGRILVDEHDLKELKMHDWRKKTSAIFQDFQKYHLSVRDNIAIGKIGLDNLKEVEYASRLSGADGVAASLPEGYDTFLGKEFENGYDLSQGQWQKIAIARAYLRNAEVMVLDEPTASLDPKSEVEIYKQFQDMSYGRMVLLISHRLGVAKLADRIIVLDNGKVVEQGTHSELMKEKGRYFDMLGIQAQWYK